MGKGNLPWLRGNKERVIPLYGKKRAIISVTFGIIVTTTSPTL